jgi:hypothetical protein
VESCASVFMGSENDLRPFQKPCDFGHSIYLEDQGDSATGAEFYFAVRPNNSRHDARAEGLRRAAEPTRKR